MEASLRVIEDIMTQVNDNKLGFLLDQKIMMDNVGRLGVEMEVDMIDCQMELIKRVFYFLQLLASGNETGKEFMRVKVSQGAISSFEVKSMLAFGVSFFNRLCKLLNVGILDLGHSVLDFFAQAIDGPCQPNQQLVIEEKFFDCVKLVVSYHKDNMELVKRGFDEEEVKVEDFYIKLLLVILGLIQGNSNCSKFKSDLRRVLTPIYLLDMITRKL